MEMPRPGEAHARLAALVGEWTGPETMHPAPWDPTGGPATGRLVNTSILDGFAVMQQYAQNRGGAESFKGHGVFWYDQAAGEYVMTWWDSVAGGGSHFRGRFEGDRLVLVSEMPQGGLCRSTFDTGRPGHYSFLMEISSDGEQWMTAMEGVYERRVGSRGPAAGLREKAADESRAVRRAAAKKKAPAKKAPGRKAPAKKAPAKKAPARKAPARKPPARKAPGQKKAKKSARGRRR
jgi:hypothetical protein